MPNQKEYRIVINGISESIGAIDSLIAKINTLEEKITALNKSGITVNVQQTGTVNTGSQTQQAQQVAEVQKQITIEIDRQNQELREQASFVDSTKQASSEVLDIANSILGTYGQNVAKLDELNQRIAANKQAQKEVADALKNEAIDAQTAAESRQRLLDEELRLKQARSETQAILKNEVKLTQAQTGSYDQMSQTLGRLRDALRASGSGLSPEAFDKVSQAVDKLDEELKSADKSVGNFQRNVGNYASAADGFGKITVTIAGVNREFESARSAIMELRNAMAQLVASGQQGTEAYKALEEQMKNLQLAMITVNDSIDKAKDASAGLHDAVEAVQGLAAIGSIGQGVSSLFGIDDSALGEQIKKLTSLMAIMQGLQQLATQMATGTGIGPALKKVLDVSGLNNNFSQLKDNLKEIGVRLGVVKSEAATASASMGNFSLAMKTAGNAAMALGKSLAAALAATGIIWAISAAIDVLKGLYDAFVNAISITKRMERANKELEASIKGVNEALRYQLEEVNRNVMIGVIDEIDKYSEKLNYIKESEKELIDIYGNLAEAATKDIFGNEHVKVALVNIDEYSKEVKELQKLMATGFDPGDTWSNMFSGEKMQQVYKANGTLARGVGDIIAQYNQLDKTNLEVMQNWVIRIKEGEQYQWVLNSAIKSGDEYLVQAATSVKNFVDGFYDGAVAARDLKTEISGMAAQMAAELAAFQKYGLKNMAAGGARDSKNKAADYLGETGVWTKEQVAEYKKMTEAQFKQQTQHNRRTTSSAKKTSNDLLQFEKNLQADKLAVMRDGLTKTLAIIEEERRARLEAINKSAVSEKKKEEARVAANTLYNQKTLDAQKEFQEKYIKADKEFKDKLLEQEQELRKQELESSKAQNDIRLNELVYAQDKEYTEYLLQPYYEQLRKLGQIANDMVEKRRQIGEEILQTADKITVLRDRLKNETRGTEEYNALKGEYDALQNKSAMLANVLNSLSSAIDSYEEQSVELQEKIAEDPLKADEADKRFGAWNNYYQELFQLQQFWRQKQLAYDKEMNEIETEQQSKAIEKEFEAQREARRKTYESLINDEEGIKRTGKTREQLQKEYNDEMFDLEVAYRSRISEVIERNNIRNNELNKKYAQETKKEFSNMYSSVINELNKFYSTVSNQNSRLKKDNTDQWGFFNLNKFREDREYVLGQFDEIIRATQTKMQKLREDLAAEKISLGDFNNAYSELEDLEDKVNDSIKELKGDNGIGDLMKGIDDWVQQFAQAFQQVLSAIFEYQNGEFDRMQEAIDKELEAVQKKYDEMEELAQKHKDAMNEIENELSTARGDRRAHLIDALSAEIQAQRDALAAQRKAEKEKEALEKKADKLELQRKKQQRKQDIIQAILNGALAISQAATNKWPVPAIPLMALAGATTAAQVAIMSKTHYAKGGLLEGKSHAQGGIPVGNTGIEVEGNEFVTNKKTTMKNLDLLYYINSKKRRLDISDFIEFYTKNEKTRKPIISNRFADGGLTPNIDLAERLVNVVVERDNREIVVSVVDINRAQQRVAQVEQLAGLQ